MFKEGDEEKGERGEDTEPWIQKQNENPSFASAAPLCNLFFVEL